MSDTQRRGSTTRSKDQICDRDYLRDPCEVSVRVSAVHHYFGFGSQCRDNVHVLDETTLLTTAGSAAVLFDRNTGESKYIFCPDSHGIGAICVHPSRNFFCVGGRGPNPNIYVYSYPGLKLYKVLKLGTNSVFSSMSFNTEGDKLASVGGAPDYMLTIWDWEKPAIILHNKAFSQDIYKVSFAPQNDGMLVTSGIGHIRFWKMANTFTGLKLQGEIGKFGKVELSDVSAYAILPDGKVISGSESGSLLLWDGIFIKFEIRKPDGSLPHQGDVHVCKRVQEDGVRLILTGGEDGYLKWWREDVLETGETKEDEPYFVCTPVRELYLEGAIPLSVCDENDYLVIQDRNGKIIQWQKPSLDSSDCAVLLQGHGGRVSGLAVSPKGHICASTGTDGVLYLWDYITKKCLLSRQFRSAATCITWVPPALDQTSTTVLVGFKDGVVRLLKMTNDAWVLVQSFKPHSNELRSITFSPDSSMVATSSVDSTVFFLKTSLDGNGLPYFDPVGFKRIPSHVNSIAWHASSDKVILACNEGTVIELCLPHANNDIAEVDTTLSFELIGIPERTHCLKLPKLISTVAVEEEKEAGEEDGPEAEDTEEETLACIGDIQTVVVDDREADRFIISVSGQNAGSLFLCGWKMELPIQIIPNTEMDDGSNNSVNDRQASPNTAECCVVTYSSGGNYLINGGIDGAIKVRSTSAPDSYALVRTHDGQNGYISSVCTSFDEKFLLSSSFDGTICVQILARDKLDEALSSVRGDAVLRKRNKLAQRSKTLDYDLLRVPVIPIAESNDDAFTPSAIANEPVFAWGASDVLQDGIDITDPAAYTIEDDKLKTKEDEKIRLANIEKEKTRAKILELRKEFEILIQENQNEDSDKRLERSVFDIDPEFIQSLIDAGEAQLEEVSKEMQYDLQEGIMKLEKLKKHYMSHTAVDSIELHSIGDQMSVKSFRTNKFSEEMTQAIETLRQARDQNFAEVTDKAEVDEESNISKYNNQGATRMRSRDPSRSEHKGWSARVAARKARHADLEEHLKRRPGKDSEDPRDVAAIQWVMKNMGDYKLKSSKDFQVAPNTHITAAGKRMELLAVADEINRLQTEFNKKFLALREIKKEIVLSSKPASDRVKEITSILGRSPRRIAAFPLELNKMEWPEESYQTCSTDNGSDSHHDTQSSTDASKGPISMENLSPHFSKFQQAVIDVYIKAANDPDSKAFMRDMKTERDQSLTRERESILSGHFKKTKAFDIAILELRQERASLACEISEKQLQQITLYREYKILCGFEAKDDALVAKLQSCKEQKLDVASAIAAGNESILVKKSELTELEFKKQEIFNKFVSTVGGEAQPSYPALLKIYKKKVKREKQQNDDDGSESEESDDDDYDDEDEEDFEDGDNGEPEEERCPDHCEESVYEEVLQLREQRLDVDELIVALTKSLDELTKLIDRQKGKQKQINKDVENVGLEIHQLENEKQRCLNQIFVFKSLNLSQLSCLVDPNPDTMVVIPTVNLEFVLGETEIAEMKMDADIDDGDAEIQHVKQEIYKIKETLAFASESKADNEEEEVVGEEEESEETMLLKESLSKHMSMLYQLRKVAVAVKQAQSRLILPETIDDCVVFDLHVLQKLHASIKKIENENVKKMAEYKELHATKAQLKKAKVLKEQEIVGLQTKCNDLQILKFGHVIDIDQVGSMDTPSAVAEMKKKLDKKEKDFHATLEDLHKEIRTEQDNLLVLTQQNTNLLAQIADLTEKQEQLDAELNLGVGGQRGIFYECSGEAQELEKIQKVISKQSKEIQSLKAQINAIKLTSKPASNQSQGHM